MGLERTGYRLTTSDDYLESIIGDMQNEFPNMSNSSNNFAVVLARILSKALEENDSIRGEGYNNVYVATAVGRHLDKAVAIGGVSRRYGTKSYGKIKVTKSSDISSISIPPGTIIESGNVQYLTNNTGYVPISSSEPVEIEIVSILAGADKNVPPESIFTPVVSIRGLDKMICEDGTYGGTDTESDQELRRRYYLTISSYSNSSLNGIISEVAKIDDVVRVSGRENNTDDELNGLPQHSFEIYCEGGADSEIAETIFYVKPAGIQTYGNVSKEIFFRNNTYNISFSRYTKELIYYKLTVRPNIGTATTELEKDIKNAIINYTASSTKINQSELIGYLYNNVTGISSLSNIAFGFSPEPDSAEEIVADVGKSFNTDEEKIELSLVGGA